MRVKKGLLVLVAVALPLSTVVLLEGTAVAKKVTGAGQTTCHFGGTINFNPPLTTAGSTSIKKEVTTVNATLGSCSGGTPVPTASTVKIKPIKVKTTKGSAGGTCSSFDSAASTIVVKVKIAWAGEKPSKLDVSNLSIAANGEGEVGFTANGFAVSGSYPGSGSLAVYLTPASGNEIATCSGSVSSLQLDESTSTSTL